MTWSGASFPARNGAGSWWWRQQMVATRPMVSDKGPGPLALRKRISTKTESSEATEVFINRKKRVQYEVWTETSGLRDSRWAAPSWQSELLLWSFLLGFLWLIILICLVHSPYLVYLRILPCVHMHLLAKMDPTTKTYGWGTSLNITPLWPPRSLFCTCMVREVSWLWEICHLGRAQTPSSLNCPAILLWSYSQ